MSSGNELIQEIIETHKPPEAKKVWQSNCRELSQWAWNRLAIKRDRHGLYSPEGGAHWSFSPLTQDELAAHFAGECTLGVGSTTPEDKCLWVAWDLDNHSDELPADANLSYAIVLMNRLVEMGFRPVIEHSDGRGGIHVWLPFSRPIDAKTAYRFSRHVAHDYQQHIPAIECLPKSPTVQNTEAKCGTYLRLPGKHHKRNHWSRFWGDGEWLEAADGIELLLSLRGDDPELIRIPEQELQTFTITHDWRSDDAVVERARKYLSRIPGAVSDNGGHNQTFHAACVLVKGFELSQDQAFDVLSEWNASCLPPWKEHELRHKIQSAAKSSGEVGYLRNAKPDRWDTIQMPRHSAAGSDTKAITQGETQTELANPRTFNGKAAAELWDLADKPVQWLVEGVFSCDQPTIFGAKQKSLKTTLLTDLAVSLASGFPWLGRFGIPAKRRVLFVTGEASEAAAIRKVRRAASSRNLRREDFTDSLRIEARTFPTLPSDKDCAAVAEAVKEHGIEVVLLDPLYMGLQGLNTANLTEVGPAMRQFMASCRPANVIIAHHVKKTASFDDAPNLEDLSQAGIAEFAGNYWLMGRMSEYTGDGMHSLAIRYGGRDEQFGLLKLDFDERDWKAEFTSLVDHREDLKVRKETERVNAMVQRIEKELGRNSEGMSEYKLAVAVGTQKDRGPFQDALNELHERKRIILIPDFKAERSRATSKGWKLAAS